MPIIGLIGAAGLMTYLGFGKKEPATPAGGGGLVKQIDTTKVIGYALGAGLILYFGKQLIKG